MSEHARSTPIIDPISAQYGACRLMTDPPPTTYYKAVRPDGTDFKTGKVRWAASERRVTRPRTVRHPSSRRVVVGKHSTSLAVSTDPTRLPGSWWPLRLLIVEPVDGHPVVECDEYKRQATAWRVVREAPSHLRFGPMGEHVLALVEQVRQMTPEEARQVPMFQVDVIWSVWSDAMDAAWDAAWRSDRGAAWNAAGDAAWYVARGASAWSARDTTRDAGRALVVRDLIGQHGFAQEHYDTLTRAVRLAGITVHPDDAPLGAQRYGLLRPESLHGSLRYGSLR